MLMPQHQILGNRGAAMSPRKLMIIGAVGMIHVIAVYALINGMATKAIKQIEHVIELTPVVEQTPPVTVPLPPKPTLVQPTTAPTPPTAPVPDIKIADDSTQPSITVATITPNTPPPVDTGVAGVMSTHSIPPYPTEARALSHQGTVVLSMSVSASGDVTAATVAQTSGFPELDQAAVAWVIAHWKYKPAMQAGQPMPSQTQAAVKFDLKAARG